MIISICGLVLLLLALLALALQRFYSSIPAKELKRLAAREDHLAQALYRPVAYGGSMRLLLWTIFGLAFSFGVLFIAIGLVPVAAFVVIALATMAVVAVQSVRLTVHSARVALHAAPALHWLLSYVHVPFGMLSRLINRVRTHDAHSGLYEKDDLIALLEQQKEQLDNRIPAHELEAVERALRFDDRQAADVLLPMSRVKMVRSDDHVGPLLLKELHDSGQQSFLAYDDTPENVVGTLFVRDAMQAREGGRVADLVRSQLIYVHEDFSLRQVLQAFLGTNSYMVVVINSFEEAVGIITLGQLLEQLVGTATDDEAVPYENRTAVAAFKPAPQLAEEPVVVDDNQPASPETTEVVE